MANIFIEGIPGSGKSTLLNRLEQYSKERIKKAGNHTYKAYREGDISPIELAWCSYMTKEEYEQALLDFPQLKDELQQHMVVEEERMRSLSQLFYIDIITSMEIIISLSVHFFKISSMS